MILRDNIISCIKDVPPLPPSATEVVGILQNPDLEISDLTKAIEHDPALAANVLRMSNSAYYGGMKETLSIRDAIMRLGIKIISNIVMMSSVSPMLWNEIKSYDLAQGDLLKHSLATMIATKEIAKVINYKMPDHLPTAALMIDIGKIVMGGLMEIDVQAIIDLSQKENVSFEEAERQLLGIDHAEVGALLLEEWSIPKVICDLIRWHHQPDKHEDDPKSASIIHVADIVGMMIGIGTGLDQLNYSPDEKVVERLGMTLEQFEYVMCQVPMEIDKLKKTFNQIARNK